MRILHTMLRVGDLQRSIDFYTGVFGMKLLRKSDNPEYKYTLAFVGFGDEAVGRGARAHLQLRRRQVRDGHGLRARRDRRRRRRGDLRRGAQLTAKYGGRITREAGPVKGGRTVIAFIEDPDGYKIELIETRDRA